MAEEYLYSIIVPLRMQARNLKKALVSAMNQTEYDKELIVVDDASTDGGAELAHKLLGDDPGCKVIIHDEPKGLWETRKTGLKAARGKYVLFLDPREWLEPDALSKLGEVALNTGSDLVQMNRRKFAGRMHVKNELPNYYHLDEKITGEEFMSLTGFLGYNTPITPYCGDKLYLRTLLLEAVNHEFTGNWGEVQIMNIHYLRAARSMFLLSYSGVNVPWADDYSNYKYSRLQDFKNVYYLKKLLGQDEALLKEELRGRLRYHVRQLLGELAWTPESICHFMRHELDDPIWKSAGETESIEEIVKKENISVKNSGLKNLFKKLTV